MVVLGTIITLCQELLKLCIRHRRAINEETFQVHSMIMEATSDLFPGILHIDTGIVAAFNFDAPYLKIIVTLWHTDHPQRCIECSRSRLEISDFLKNWIPLARVTGQRTFRTYGHVGKKIVRRAYGRFVSSG